MWGRSHGVSNEAVATNLGETANELYDLMDDLRRSHEAILSLVNQILTGHQLEESESTELNRYANDIVNLIKAGRDIDFEGAIFNIKALMARVGARNEW